MSTRVFVTGASGWIGSALIPELISAGHKVTALARSDASAAALTKAGALVHRGDLDDLDALRSAAQASDGVIHLAFNVGLALSGDFQGAVDADLRAVGALGEALTGSGRPLVMASVTLVLEPGRVGTEADAPSPEPAVGLRVRSAPEQAALSFASRGVRSSAVRLPTTVYGDGDHGFLAAQIAIARARGVSGFIGDGSNRWPAVHRLDAAHAFLLALENAPAGSRLHAVADEGVPTRAIAEVIGRHLELPVLSVPAGDATEHFGPLAPFLAVDNPASSALTRDLLGWQPTRPGLIDDLGEGHYFASRPAPAAQREGLHGGTS
ncbi:SDR family oxidoreductase [Streptomyces hyaluromycini]|uniref:SDR family oxidoreductase n=1 Tax=Streptomyces hyaluromycini TaxID=1377993 RepID=UPI000B5C9F96|nr:SDR family oxidoreductase [Streptomyces hyaluromycini]